MSRPKWLEFFRIRTANSPKVLGDNGLQRGTSPESFESVTHPAQPPGPSPSQCPILFKLDDLRIGRVCDKWEKVFQLVARHECKISVGIISEGADIPGNVSRYSKNVAWLTRWRSHPLIEFWNHSHSHTKATYCGASLESQIADIKQNEAAVTPVFGRGLRIFGAPFNSLDEQTATACLASDINIIFHALEPTPAGLDNIPSCWFLAGPESVTGEKSRVPNVKRILRALPAHFHKYPMGVVQFHPLAWDDHGFAEFESLIEQIGKLGHPTVTAASFLQQRKLRAGSAA